MNKRHPNVTNLNEAESFSREKGSKFGFSAKRLAHPSGAKALGCMYYEIQPGRTAFPNHYHCANEEGVYIIEGSALARIGKDELQVGAEDYIAYPVGPEYSHSLKNTGETILKYLCFSTMLPTEVVGYPDSKKVAGVGCFDPETGIKGAKLMFIHRDQPSADYYEGEDVG